MSCDQGRTLSVLMVAGFLLFASGSGLGQESVGKRTALAELSRSFEALSERIGPAVVQVIATGYGSGIQSLDSALLSKQHSGGSGVILDSDGYLVTNAHVVEGAQRIQVLLAISRPGAAKGKSILKPRGKVLDAEIVGIDRETDLAVLRIGERELPFLELGDSDELKQGQLVLVFGSPLGLENSVSLGVVSSVARQLRPEDPTVYIQTDAPINLGNSGGPLVDANGKVVGINTFIITQSGGSEGLGFAVPSNIVKNVFTQIRNGGHVRRGRIGVYSQTVTPALAKGLGLSQQWGVVLGDVFPGGPAHAIGLKPGDLVLTLDGKVVENGRQFDVNLYRYAVGEIVTLEVLRGSRKLTFRVRVVQREDDSSARFAEMVTPERNLVSELGILGIDVDARIAQALPSRKLGGVLVAARSPSSFTWQESFLPGDIIYEVNGKSITSLASLRAVLALLKRGDEVAVQVQRQGLLRFIPLVIE